MRRALLAIGALFGLLLVFIVVVGLLAFVGGPSLDAECGERSVDPSGQTSAAFDGKWDAFDDQVAAGVPSTVAFTEAEATQRSRAFLIAENIDEIQDVTICFFAGSGEARGKGAIPVLPDVNAKISGTMDLSGPFPVLAIEDIDIGSAGFIIDLFGLEGEIEDAVNAALEELDLDNAPYGLTFGEGAVTISGG